MNHAEAIKTIESLAHGTDPVTGEVFPDDSPYNHPTVIRALFHTIKVLEGAAGTAKRQRTLPGNAGKPWSDEEDRQLAEAFDAGTAVAELAARHQRTKNAITSRLIRLGKMPPAPTADVVTKGTHPRRISE